VVAVRTACLPKSSIALVVTHAVQALSALSASKEAAREAWATWNPQRAAVRELQQQIEAGTVTLEVTGVVRNM
jgi:hypothetical protein